MSVASTKAFYAQIAAGFLLAVAIADEVGDAATGAPAHELLDALRDAARRDGRRARRSATAIAEAARRLAPPRRYWAVVGNGPNRIAADEVRIKLSELCYKSIACDATEDKKHIDLSSEPLILVCAAGLQRLERRRRGQGGRDLPGPQGGADRDRHRGRASASRAALQAIAVPAGAPALGVRAVGHGRPPLRLRGGAGHRRARPRRCARPGPRSRRRSPATSTATALDVGSAALDPHRGPAPASSTACAPARTTATSRPAPRCGSRRCCATPPASLPLDAYQVEYGKVGHARASWSRTSPRRSPPASTS